MRGTRERILETALSLFSERGYEAVSVGQLADAVGIKAPSLYKHFASKQEIFDALLAWVSRQYDSQPMLLSDNRQKNQEEYESFARSTPQEIAERLWEKIRQMTHHPVISRVRKLLSVEQFRSPLLGRQMEKRQYRDIFEYHRQMIRYLIGCGILAEGDDEIMALQFMAPISVEMQRVDRNPGVEEEAAGLIKRHVTQFFRIYGRQREEV